MKQLWPDRFPPGQTPIEVAARSLPWWLAWTMPFATASAMVSVLTRSQVAPWMYVSVGIGIMAFAIFTGALVVKLRQRGKP